MCQQVVFSAKEQMRDQGGTDAIVPRLWVLGQCQAPDLAHMLDVVRVVEVQLGRGPHALNLIPRAGMV